MKKFTIILILSLATHANAQTLSDRLAASAIETWNDSTGLISSDDNNPALLLEGMDLKWRLTADARYFQYMQKTTDFYLNQAKSFKDSIPIASAVLIFYKTTGKEKYLKTATSLYDQWRSSTALKDNTADIYLTEPFHAAYAAMIQDTGAFSKIAARFNDFPKDPKTISWYTLAMVNVLDEFPEDYPGRKEFIRRLKQTAAGIKKYPDPVMLYALQKAIRKEWLPDSYSKGITKTYDSALNKMTTTGPEAVAAFLPAATEAELAAISKTGKGKTVILDNYFNHEIRKDPATGQMQGFHYIWPERDINGYSFFCQSFESIGAKTLMLKAAPSANNLKGKQIYIIVDPDTEKETARPNYMEAQDIKVIADWVKAGGVLVMFLNDSNNAEFSHFNKLPETFGIHFNEDSKNKVTGSRFDMGAILIPEGHPIFKTAKKVYIKELSTITVKPPAMASLSKDGDIIIATAKYGKGTVFAVGDPWFYNEYTDGRKLPAEFENYRAANDLAKWLVQQAQ